MRDRKKSVLITGCASGMGRVSAIYLAQHGYKVYAGSRTPDKLKSIESKDLIPIRLDIKDFKSIEKTLKDIKRVDILVNNAGYGLVSSVEEVSEEQMLEQFDVNVFGVFRVCKAVIPKMRDSGGVIINISSFLGKIGLPLLTFYNSSKYALEGITDSLRHELKPFGIRVHSILPGFFDTNFARENLVTNKKTFSDKSPYKSIVSTLAPTLIEQINNGNDKIEVAKLILKIIEDKDFKARVAIGDKAKKFIPMRQVLSDEEFEDRVEGYYLR